MMMSKKKRQYKRTVKPGTVFLFMLMRLRSSAIAAKTAATMVIQLITVKI